MPNNRDMGESERQLMQKYLRDKLEQDSKRWKRELGEFMIDVEWVGEVRHSRRVNRSK